MWPPNKMQPPKQIILVDKNQDNSIRSSLYYHSYFNSIYIYTLICWIVHWHSPDLWDATLLTSECDVIAGCPLVEFHLQREWRADLWPHQVYLHHHQAGEASVGIYPLSQGVILTCADLTVYTYSKSGINKHSRMRPLVTSGGRQTG